MSTLTIFCGLPGSGKTTAYRQNFDTAFGGAIRLSLDEFRLLMTGKDFEPSFEPEVHQWSERTTKYLLCQGHDVVVDATFLKKPLRAKWIELAKECKAEICCAWMNVPASVCFLRNEKRDRTVPNEVMDKMTEEFEPPTQDEGFVKIMEFGE